MQGLGSGRRMLVDEAVEVVEVVVVVDRGVAASEMLDEASCLTLLLVRLTHSRLRHTEGCCYRPHRLLPSLHSPNYLFPLPRREVCMMASERCHDGASAARGVV